MVNSHSQVAPRFDRLIVKFNEGGEIHQAADGSLQSKPYSMDPFHDLLAQHGNVVIRRSFSASPADMHAFQDALEAELGETYPFLNLYVRVRPPPGTDLLALASDLSALNEVESVSLAGPFRPPQPVDPLDFRAEQGYLRPATEGGIDAEYAWQFPGGKGLGVTVCDCEWGFHASHVDLPVTGTVYNIDGNLTVDENHGTQVLGLLGAPDAAVAGIVGITGICHEASLTFASVSATTPGDPEDHHVTDAIKAAIDALSAGDVLLLELEASVDGYWVPAEWDPDVRTLISLARGKRIPVVEAAGNGNDVDGLNLADVTDLGGNHIWDRSKVGEFEDTKALIVGAGWQPGIPGVDARSRLKATNYGDRVDCQGWGTGVLTTGCCQRYSDPADDNLNWTYFTHTSAAAAMVAGAVACLQGAAARALPSGPLHPDDVADRFRDPENGSYQPGNEPANRVLGAPAPSSDAANGWIGSLPDLRKIVDPVVLMTSIYLRDGAHDSGTQPIEDLRCLGPDIVPAMGPLAHADEALGPDHWDDPALGENFVLDEGRQVYLRVRNRADFTDQGRVTLYWSRPSTWYHPSFWHEIAKVDTGRVRPGESKVLAPVPWVPAAGGPSGPAVLISSIVTRRTSIPVPAADVSTREFLEAIHGRHGVRFRSLWTLPATPGTYTEPFPVALRGLPDADATFHIRVRSRVPPRTDVRLRLPPPSGDPVVDTLHPFEPPFSRLEIPVDLGLDVPDLPLGQGDRRLAELTVRLPSGTAAGRYVVSVEQRLGRRQLGRLTLVLEVP